jgi:carboxyl-terminal processing protease
MINKKIFLGFSALFIAVASCSFTNTKFETSDKDKLLLNLITYVLDQLHYEPKDINDTFSEDVYTGFIEMCDPSKRYFLKSDLEDFEQYRYQIDEEIENRELAFFNTVHERLVIRMEEARGIYQEVLDEPFDYAQQEELDIDYNEQDFVSNRKELRERWRKQMKYFTLGQYDALVRRKLEETYGSNEEGEDASFEFSPEMVAKISAEDLAELEKEARESTRTNTDYFFKVRQEQEREDWFVMYLNTIVSEFDPHSGYFPPEDKEDFDERISGTFEGIGARLQPQPEGPKIVEIISGGPAWKSKKLEVGDEIIKVGQEGEEPVDIMGMQLSDAVKLIKGPKGTVVYLTVRRVNGTIEEIDITRDVVEIEETFAKSAKIEREASRYGIIQLPTFYADFEDFNSNNAAKDVRRELEELKKEGVEGVIIDLRDNGGGSLKAVEDMIGLFIETGPVVQVRSPNNEVRVYEDKDAEIVWDGPVVVLVNELSASASEIFAAAIQDYGRGVVLGTRQTYGKGTVQRFYPLETLIRGNQYGDLGSLKFTTQKFYRIDGGSTQLEGVKSDVVIPGRTSYLYLGEKDQQNPLSWDKIRPANYDLWYDRNALQEVIASSQERVNAHPQVQMIDKSARWLKEQQDQTVVSLSYADYSANQLSIRKQSTEFDSLTKYDSALDFTSPMYENQLFTKDPVLREKRDRWHKDMATDVYIEEAVNVLSDLKSLEFKKGSTERLARVKG